MVENSKPRGTLTESIEKQYDPFAFIVSRVVRWKLGQEPSETIKNDWVVVARAARMIDWQIDNTPNTSKRLSFIGELDGFLNGQCQTLEHGPNLVRKDTGELRDVLQKYPLKNRLRFGNDGRLLLKVTEKTRMAGNADTLSTCKRLEGQIVVRLFLDLLPDEFRHNPKFSDLRYWITRWTRVGACFDAAFDLQSDFDNKEVVVPPTTINRLKIFWRAIPDAVATLKKSDVPFLVWGFSTQGTRIVYGMLREKLVKK